MEINGVKWAELVVLIPANTIEVRNCICFSDGLNRREMMKYVVNIEDKKPDTDKRSLRHAVSNRKSEILRDTYYLVDANDSPSKNLTMGQTIIYPTGKTTGHAHSDMEEVYYILSGKGKMVVGDDEFEIKAGDSFYVPFGEFHVTYNTGNQPLAMVWVTGKDPANS
jgi:mannose-6-phosphate isomerase-like protein (cupin superfamily)